MDLPTYTNIWRIEKRLYKLYDFRLPAPLPITWIAVFAGITVPYVVFLVAVGLPFNHNLVWLYVLPPGVLTWLTTRPVIESKRLPELIGSQLRYVSEPRVWYRMTAAREKDEITVTVRVWHRNPPKPRRKDGRSEAKPVTPSIAPVRPVAARPAAGSAAAAHPAAAHPAPSRPAPARAAAQAPVFVPAASPGPSVARQQAVPRGFPQRATAPAPRRASAPPPPPRRPAAQGPAPATQSPSRATPDPSRATPAPQRPTRQAPPPQPPQPPSPPASAPSPEPFVWRPRPAPVLKPAPAARQWPRPAPILGDPGQIPDDPGPIPSDEIQDGPVPVLDKPTPARTKPAPPPDEPTQAKPTQAEPTQHEPPAPASQASATAPPPAARPLAAQPRAKVVNLDEEAPLPSVERALGAPGSGRRELGWRRRVKIVAGGQGPGRRDQESLDADRARLSVAGQRWIVVLGCTASSGQTLATVVTGRMLATLRQQQVAALTATPTAEPNARTSTLLSGNAQLTPTGVGLDLIHDDAGTEYAKLAALVNPHYQLTVVDPAPAAMTRLLDLADQLLIVAPPKAEAATSLANLQQWLDAHGYGDLAAQAVTAVNGVTKENMTDVLRVESVARGRCRAIVRLPWDPMLPRTRAPQSRLAFTALAGVLIAGLAARQPAGKDTG